MERRIVIGDIHGCNKTFKKLLFEVLAIRSEDQIYVLGDFVDRGPDSIGVINTILELKENAYQICCLRGNHEQLMIDSVNNVSSYFQWLLNGGDSTMEDFGVRRFQDFPKSYQDFINSTVYYVELADFILVHAGLNFKKANLFEDTTAMLWSRKIKPVEAKLGNRKLIHGHTPIPLESLLQQTGNCINLDGGCVFKNQGKGQGYLVALLLDTMEFVYTECIDILINEGKE